MQLLTTIAIVLGTTLLTILFLAAFYIIIRFRKLHQIDRKQEQHAIRRNYPLVGRLRYMAEQIAPEVMQYFTNGDNEGKPYSRLDFQQIVRFAKYGKSIISFGSKRDFEKSGFYIRNAFFAKQLSDLKVDNSTLVKTKKYMEQKGKKPESSKEKYKELFFPKKEQFVDAEIKPWLYRDKDAVILGEHTCKHPMMVKSPVGMSAMSYGALGEHAIEALGLGLAEAGSFMNTGEGGVSPYHLKSGVDIISQIGPAKFGYRNEDGSFSWEKLQKKAKTPQIKAFELKLGQGAKIRGGHIEGSKVTPQIAEIRGVEPWKTLDSPNRFDEFHDYETMFDFIEKIRSVSGKPVGIKMVIGSQETFEEFVHYMKETNRYPDFISIDGSEGGTGATYRAMADSVGLPIKSALMIAQQTLVKYKMREKVKIIASGRLFSPDQIAIALAMGADLVQVARGLMIAVGCIGAEKCASGLCPVGVATTDPKLQQALVVEEKRYRVTNYIVTIREELFALSAAAGLNSPNEFKEKHVVFVNDQMQVMNLSNVQKKEEKGFPKVA